MDRLREDVTIGGIVVYKCWIRRRRIVTIWGNLLL